jgi:hypothetical protein
MQKWYQKTSGIVALLILFFPVGIYLMWKHTNWSKNVKIVVTVLAALMTITVMATSPKTPKTEKPVKDTVQKQEAPKAVAKFEGTILGYEAQNPASLRVVAEVKNSGNAEGKFNCTIRGKDSGSNYTGFDMFEAEVSQAPDEVRKLIGNITITKEGAAYVTDVSISCK